MDKTQLKKNHPGEWVRGKDLAREIAGAPAPDQPKKWKARRQHLKKSAPSNLTLREYRKARDLVHYPDPRWKGKRIPGDRSRWKWSTQKRIQAFQSVVYGVLNAVEVSSKDCHRPKEGRVVWFDTSVLDRIKWRAGDESWERETVNMIRDWLGRGRGGKEGQGLHPKIRAKIYGRDTSEIRKTIKGFSDWGLKELHSSYPVVNAMPDFEEYLRFGMKEAKVKPEAIRTKKIPE